MIGPSLSINEDGMMPRLVEYFYMFGRREPVGFMTEDGMTYFPEGSMERVERERVSRIISHLFPGADEQVVLEEAKKSAGSLGLELEEYLEMVKKGKEQSNA